MIPDETSSSVQITAEPRRGNADAKMSSSRSNPTANMSAYSILKNAIVILLALTILEPTSAFSLKSPSKKSASALSFHDDCSKPGSADSIRALHNPLGSVGRSAWRDHNLRRRERVVFARTRRNSADWSGSDTIDTTDTTSHVEERDSSSFYFIRDADFADVNAASRILTNAFFADNTNFLTYPIERLKTFLSLESTFPKSSSERSDHAMIVICRKSDGKVLGFAELENRRTRKPKGGGGGAPEDCPYMFNLAVERGWQRKGFAKALVRYCERESAVEWREDRMCLKVKKLNVAAIRLYRSLGYDRLDEESSSSSSGYASVPRDEWVLTKDLVVDDESYGKD